MASSPPACAVPPGFARERVTWRRSASAICIYVSAAAKPASVAGGTSCMPELMLRRKSTEKADLNKAVEAERTATFLLANPEKKALRWMAAALPKWVLPDDLTIL